MLHVLQLTIFRDTLAFEPHNTLKRGALRSWRAHTSSQPVSPAGERGEPQSQRLFSPLFSWGWLRSIRGSECRTGILTESAPRPCSGSPHSPWLSALLCQPPGVCVSRTTRLSGHRATPGGPWWEGGGRGEQRLRGWRMCVTGSVGREREEARGNPGPAAGRPRLQNNQRGKGGRDAHTTVHPREGPPNVPLPALQKMQDG